jgi:hypothetical protein
MLLLACARASSACQPVRARSDNHSFVVSRLLHRERTGPAGARLSLCYRNHDFMEPLEPWFFETLMVLVLGGVVSGS